MKSNKYAVLSQTSLLIIVFGILVAMATMPAARSARYVVYKAMCHYYNAPPRWSVVRLFDKYAENFDEHLTTTLEYKTPYYLTEFIHSNATLTNPIKKVLDLGCGTGLLGQALIKQFNIESLTGVDLSTKMLKKSKDKKIYNLLYKADILEYLQSDNESYDTITAADVFIYVGDLKAVMTAVHQRLKLNGYFAFSVETIDSGTFTLTSSGRFQHSLNYLQLLAIEIGFQNIKYNSVELRKEHNVMVPGYIILMQK